MQYNKIRKKNTEQKKHNMGVFLVNQITQITEPRGVQTAIRPYHPFIFIMKLKQKIIIQTTKQSSTETKTMKIPLSDSIFRDSFREPREVPAHFARIRNYLEILLSAISFRGVGSRLRFWAPSWPNALRIRVTPSCGKDKMCGSHIYKT